MAGHAPEKEMTVRRRRLAAWVLALAVLTAGSALALDYSILRQWRSEFPKNAFANSRVELEGVFDIAHRDAIPAIEDPKFVPVAKSANIDEREPVIGVTIGGAARAYPLQVMTWHEIVNDVVGGVPIAVTYCPLSNSIIVFDRRLDGQVLSFGATGRLRHSNLVMYDRESETWWQQFTGEGLVGERAGAQLEILPARLESLARFRARAPQGVVLVPRNAGMRPYGQNPYPHYDSMRRPTQYFQGKLPAGIAPLARVVAVGGQAWALDFVREKGRIVKGDLEIAWEPGQLSALDAVMISTAKDVGNVTVRRRTKEGYRDEAHTIGFAFAFHAFHPGAIIAVR